jgi:hypothetical protein
VSLLIDHGHPEAMSYPVGMVWDESRLVIERLNGFEVTRATLLQMAVSSMFSKEAGDAFRKELLRLNGD